MDNLPFNSSRLDLIERKNYQKKLQIRDSIKLDIDTQTKEFLAAGGKIQHIDKGVSSEIYGHTRRQMINRVHIKD